jgi:hypothetical protein
VPGFRVGAGPRGNYVHMGRHGLYYRASPPSALCLCALVPRRPGTATIGRARQDRSRPRATSSLSALCSRACLPGSYLPPARTMYRWGPATNRPARMDCGPNVDQPRPAGSLRSPDQAPGRGSLKQLRIRSWGRQSRKAPWRKLIWLRSHIERLTPMRLRLTLYRHNPLINPWL